MFLFCALFFGSAEVSALSLENESTDKISIFDESVAKLDDKPMILRSSNSKNSDDGEKSDETKPQKKAAEPNKVYTVESGDTLSKIADQHDVSWERLFYKNVKIGDPNQISVGDKITIPKPSEKLKKRAIPAGAPVEAEPIVQPQQPQQVAAAQPAPAAPAPAPQPTPVSSAGNTYYYGYCTWYAKSRRPDLPNNLGNANTWVSMAAAQGIATSSTPRAGAIGQQGMHVVYVESVNANGTVTVSEMNFNGWGVVSSRTVPASTFSYIL